jgi:HprK-related kinase A
VRIRSDIAGIAQDIASMYAQFDTCAKDSFADFHVAVLFDGVSGRLRRRVRFFFDGMPSFTPLPLSQAFAMLEWGLNWCVAAHSHQYLVIHAAVVERAGRAAILPGPPGAGKSTLCAGLVNRGWRLLSDELALLDMEANLLYGMCRPVNLKNASIDVIRRFAPDAVMTRPMSDTGKGTIALMRPPAGSVGMAGRPARPAWIVAPRHSPGARPALDGHGKAETFMSIAQQSFNYDIHGPRGFSAIGRLVDACQCHRFVYGDLDDAVRAFDGLHEGIAG